jgi:hypothetical protein
VNFYQRQWWCLRAALTHAGHGYSEHVVEEWFRRYHGYKDHAGAWKLFPNIVLLQLAVSLLATRRSEHEGAWRRLWCITLDEISRRGLLPNGADLRVAWDVCLAEGAIDLEQPPSLLELWVLARPLLLSRSVAA